MPNNDCVLDFDDDYLVILKRAIEAHSGSDRSLEVLQACRLPKYTSLLGSSDVLGVPSDDGLFFDSCEEDHIEVLLLLELPHHNLLASAPVLLFLPHSSACVCTSALCLELVH